MKLELSKEHMKKIRLFNDGNDINLCAKGIHTKEAVMKMAVEAGLIESDETFHGEAESGWWKAVPHCECGVEYWQSSETVRGAFQATFVSKWG